MKNVILTHNELQLNLFYAVSYGLQFHNPIPDHHIVTDVTDRDFIWKIVKHHSVEGNAVLGQPVFFHYVNKGEYQMNDLRIGVTINYLRDEAEKFLENFKKFLEGAKSEKTI